MLWCVCTVLGVVCVCSLGSVVCCLVLGDVMCVSWGTPTHAPSPAALFPRFNPRRRFQCLPLTFGSLLSPCLRMEQRFIVTSSPFSSTITDAISKYWNPCSHQCRSRVNLVSCNPVELLHRSGSAVHSMSCNWHDSYSCVSPDSFRTVAFLFFCEPRFAHRTVVPFKTTPSSCEHRCQAP